MLLIPEVQDGQIFCITPRKFRILEINKDHHIHPFLILKRVDDDEECEQNLDQLDYFTYLGHLYQVKDGGKGVICHGVLQASVGSLG